MCAIAGFSGNTDRIPKEKQTEMLSTMSRRGPDANGSYTAKNCILLHSRLAVVDIEGGRQPMTYKINGAKYTIVYNGELYNTDEVRNRLFGLGAEFTTASDTEVILKAYALLGEGCLDIMNGIFAFAILNEDKNELFIARDRLGVKPFFYAFSGDDFIFASEIKTILASGLISPKINRDGISELILIAPGRTPGSAVFEGIKELLPGTCGYLKSGKLRLKSYWRLTDRPHTDSLADTIINVNKLLRDSVERQLVSDVPIGTFLSGGLDSSLISSIANRYMKRNGKKLITFSVGYRDNKKYFKPSHFQPNSDEEYIKEMCEYLSCEHVDVTLDTEDLASGLHEAVTARDLPGMADVDSSLLMFSKEIKKYVSVALSGECADEIFGGYPWYRDKDIRERYGFPWSDNYSYRAEFLSPEIRNKINPRDYVSARYEAYCAAAPKLDRLDGEETRMREMTFLNYYWFMQTLLDRKDRMTMYSGLEVRVPFCDHRIAQYLYSTPWSMKDLGGYEKGLLRTAFDGYLPDNVLWRKKSPYPKTHNPAYRKAVTDMLTEVINNPSEPIHTIIDKSRIETLMASDSATPWYGQLMTVPQTVAYFYMLNDWLKTYKVSIEI